MSGISRFISSLIDPARAYKVSTNEELELLEQQNIHSKSLVMRPYQEEGRRFLESKQRAMLLDEAGLGKTIQASMAAYHHKPVLVACPTYLVAQWNDHIQEHYPDDTVAMCVGTAKQRIAALLQHAQWTIINVEMFRSYNLKEFRYATLIVDEAHHLKGHRSSQSLGALEVALRTSRVYLLTATPIKREPDDLYMLLRLLDSRRFKSYWRFVENYCRIFKTPYGDKVVGAKDPPTLRALLGEYAIKRGYSDVHLSLPPLIEQTLPIRPSKKWADDYRQVKETYRKQVDGDSISITAATGMYNELRRMTATCAEKVEAIQGLISDAPQYEQVLVFCWYKATAHLLGELLEMPVIDGDMPADKRKVVAQDNPRVVATIASLSEGIDLSAKKLVIYYEEEHTPGTMYQSLARAHRWSEDMRPVRAYYLNIKGTIDESVHRVEGRRDRTVIEVLKEHMR